MRFETSLFPLVQDCDDMVDRAVVEVEEALRRRTAVLGIHMVTLDNHTDNRNMVVALDTHKLAALHTYKHTLEETTAEAKAVVGNEVEAAAAVAAHVDHHHDDEEAEAAFVCVPCGR